MNDVFDEMVERLKQKAKTTNWIYETYFRTEDLHALAEWVRLEVALNILNELRQNYVIIPKAELGELFKIITSDVHPLKLKKFVEELLKE